MPGTHRGVVVVAEDDDDLREMTGELLEGAGYLVLGARDGTEALARLRGISGPVIAIVDLIMPEMDGWTLVSRMRNDSTLSRIPIIVVSGQNPASIDGSVGYVRKPYAPSTLLSLIATFCR